MEKTILASGVLMVNRLDSMGMACMGKAYMGMVPNHHPTNRDDANPTLGDATVHPSILGRSLPYLLLLKVLGSELLANKGMQVLRLEPR
jgi:hypothetical protein